MNQLVTADNDTAPRLPQLHAGSAVRAIVPVDFEGAWRIASAVCKAGMAPRTLETPEKAMVAILHGLEVGMTPMSALQSIAVIGGRPTIWGDGALGLVQASGKMLSHEEFFEGEGDGLKAVCIVVRAGDPKPKRGSFSIADAKKASLWSKAGPWQQYPQRMLMMRARAFALRDGFADVLRGLGITEEVQDIPNKAPEPREDPPAPPAAPIAVEVTAQVTEDAAAEKAAVIEVNEIVPDPINDLEAFKTFCEQRFISSTSAEHLNEMWTKYVEPVEASLFPPDQDDLMGAYRKMERILS